MRERWKKRRIQQGEERGGEEDGSSKKWKVEERTVGRTVEEKKLTICREKQVGRRRKVAGWEKERWTMMKMGKKEGEAKLEVCTEAY